MTKLLYVYGDGDYEALSFNEHYNPQEVYKEMVSEGVKRKDLLDPEWGVYSIHVEIREFGDIDPKFVSFMFDKLIDYDITKSRDIFFIEEDENN